jgi:predicted Fe-Mo cluster-binding NifX family protein
MKLCIPVTSDQGFDSEVCEHFGTAPCLLVIESDSMELSPAFLLNGNHTRGIGESLAFMAGQNIQAVFVRDTGDAALASLQTGRFEVFKTEEKTVRETIGAFKTGSLSQLKVQPICMSHGRPTNCS